MLKNTIKLGNDEWVVDFEGKTLKNIKAFYEDWIAGEMQTDDIVIFGFKIP